MDKVEQWELVIMFKTGGTEGGFFDTSKEAYDWAMQYADPRRLFQLKEFTIKRVE